MHRTQRRRAQEMLDSHGLQRALFANAVSIRWLTGFAPPVQTGPYPFLGGPPLLWYQDGTFTLVLVGGHARWADDFASDPGCAVRTYPGYSLNDPIDPGPRLMDAVSSLMALDTGRDRAGIEGRDAPFAAACLLRERTAGDLVSIDGWLTPLRMVKTPEEIEGMRQGFALTGIGHQAARRAVQDGAGRREIDIWNAVHSAIQEAAGERVALGEDCVVGRRPDNLSGWPGAWTLDDGDSIIVDIAPFYRGYWGDSAGTYYPGSPTARQAAMHRAVAEGLEYGASLLRPGAVAGEIDAQLRAFMARSGFPVHPHHSGHGIGVTVHERPRLVPNGRDVLEENMVIMLEPGIYLPGETSVRLEDAFLITAGGAVALTAHDKSLP